MLAALAGSGPSASGAPTFSPRDIYALPDHNYIDDRCQSARVFADHAAATTDDIDRDGAIAGANVFYKCFTLARVNPDENAQRYLYLATATALYMAATKSGGPDAAKLLTWSQSMARELGAVGPDRTVVLEHVVQGGRLNSADNPVPVNPTHEYWVIDRSSFGTAHAGKFTPEANALADAIGAQAALLAAAAQQTNGTSAPSPRPSISGPLPGASRL